MPAGPSSIPEAIEHLRKTFEPDASRGARVSYRFDLTGDGGGTLGLRVDDGRLELRPGAVAAPDAVFRLEAADFFAVLEGTANPDLLFLQKRLAVEGDLSLALKIRRFFAPRR
jgi:hypothetical protein